MSNRIELIATLTPKQAVVYREAREAGFGIDVALEHALRSSRTLDYYDRVSRGDFHEPNGDLK